MVSCSVPDCKSRTEKNDPGITFHRIPKNETRRLAWLREMRRKSWVPSATASVCSKHFEKDCFIITKKYLLLSKTAIPTKEMPVTDIGRKRPSREIKDVKSSKVISFEKKIKRLEQKVKDLTLANKELVAKEAKLSKKLNKFRCFKFRANKRICSLKSATCAVQQQQLIEMEELAYLKKSFDKDCLLVTKEATKKTYSSDIRKFSMTMHYHSPRAYEYLRSLVSSKLPHPKTISRWYKTVNCNPGFTVEALNKIKAKCASVQEATFGVLIMDEMAIRPHLEWDGNSYYGHINAGVNLEGDDMPLAKEALTFVVVGLNGSWKIPVGYFLINGISGLQKSNIMKALLDVLAETGIIIVGITFDGAANNAAMVKYLGCDLDKFESTIWHNKRKIFVIPDACHNLKLIRNTFATKKQIVNGKGEIIDWNFIEQLHELQENEGLHLRNKLRSQHINFIRQKMKVKLAVQTLSNSIADAIDFCRDTLKIESFKDSEPTTEFIRNINNMFDICNSRNCKAYGFKSPLHPKNSTEIFQYFDHLSQYIKQLEWSDGIKITNSRTKTGFRGFVVCMESIKNIYVETVGKGLMKFLCTYKLSQDHIEVLFSAIRAKGGFNNNPTARQFMSAYKKLLSHADIKHFGNTNCTYMNSVELLDINIENVFLETINNSTTKGLLVELEQKEVVSHDHDYLLSVDPSVYITEYGEKIIEYIAGYVCAKIASKLKCEICFSALLDLEKEKRNESFIELKDKGGLKYPSTDLIHVCKLIDKEVRLILKLNKGNLGNHMAEITNNVVRCVIGTNVFKCLKEHMCDNEPLENHLILLIKTVCKCYVDLRIHHVNSKINEPKERIRSFYNKLVLFQGQ